LALTWHITRVQELQAQEHAERDLANLSNLTKEHALRTLRAADQALQLVRALYLRDGDRLDLAHWVRQGAIDTAISHQVGVIDARGIYRFSNLPQTPAVDLSDREHFRVHAGMPGDALFISKPVVGRVSKKWTIQLTRHIESDGRFLGVAVVSMDADYFSRAYADLDVGAHGSVTLLGQDGVVRARFAGSAAVAGGESSTVRESITLDKVQQGLTQGMFEATSPIDQTQRLFHFRSVPGYPLVAMVGYGVDDFRDPIRHNVRMYWIGALVACALAVALAGLFSWHQAREHGQREQLQRSQRHTRLALESGGLGVWEWSLQDQQFVCDDRLRALLGLASDTPLTREVFLERLHPDDLPTLQRLLPVVLKGQQDRLVYEHRIRHPDGRWVWLVARGQVVERDDQGHALRMMGTDADVTQYRLTQEAARVAALAFKSSAAMMICAADQTILSVNPAFEALSGYTAAECIGQRANLLKSGRQSPAFYLAMWAQLHGPDAHWEGELWNRRKDGEVFLDWLSISAVKDEQGKISHFVAVHADITLRKRGEEEVRRLAFFDPLTGLPNRRLLLDRLQQMRASLVRQRQIGALLFLDLDHFKTLNDTHGHALGDELLIQVATRLPPCVREGDTVARLGGDEFVVALAQLGTDPQRAEMDALNVAHKIRNVLAQPYVLDGKTWQLSVSIGVALINQADVSIDEVLRQADVAMYHAKSAGRDGVKLYHPE